MNDHIDWLAPFRSSAFPGLLIDLRDKAKDETGGEQFNMSAISASNRKDIEVAAGNLDRYLAGEAHMEFSTTAPQTFEMPVRHPFRDG